MSPLPAHHRLTADRAAATRLLRPAAIPPLRVLVIDDEAAIREVLTISLSGDGHTVITAADGPSGLEHFRGGDVDIVLVDRAMPGMQGGEVAAEIRRQAPQTPIVMVSGSLRMAAELSDSLAAIDAFVAKPFTLEQLREGIAKALRAHEI